MEATLETMDETTAQVKRQGMNAVQKNNKTMQHVGNYKCKVRRHSMVLEGSGVFGKFGGFEPVI